MQSIFLTDFFIRELSKLISFFFNSYCEYFRVQLKNDFCGVYIIIIMLKYFKILTKIDNLKI